jgi:hypothetical protein
MSNSSIDNKLNEINDRNRQDPQNEPDEEENMSGFEKGRLAALNAKYEDDDEPKKRNGNNEGFEEEESQQSENDEEDGEDDNNEDNDDDDNDNDDKNDEKNDDKDNEKNNKSDENENKSNDKNSDDKENSDKPDSRENKKEKDSKNQNNKEPQSPTDNKKPAEKPQTPKAGQEGTKEGTKQAGKEGAKQAGKEGAKQAGKEGAKQAAKEGAKAAAKAGTKVAAKAGIAASPPVLIVILVIVAIILLIGIISFFSIMGDMIIGKLKNFLQGVWDALQTVTTGDQAYANINDEHVKNAASYLEQMGYDLVGMGFVKTEYNTTNKNEGEAWNKWYNENGELIEEKSASNKKEDLIEREEDTTEDESEGEKSGAEQKDPIKKIKSEPIRKYLVAALRSYINGAYGGMVVQEGHEADGLWNTVFDKIAFNSKEHTLTVTKGDTHVKVNLESWTAKYGMSFEFLVCLHLGTLAPEFVMDLAGDADNRVKVVVNFFKQERNKKI